jgi:hypothetical protein
MKTLTMDDLIGILGHRQWKAVMMGDVGLIVIFLPGAPVPAIDDFARLAGEKTGRKAKVVSEELAIAESKIMRFLVTFTSETP